jgi:hypothetical protein
VCVRERERKGETPQAGEGGEGRVACVDCTRSGDVTISSEPVERRLRRLMRQVHFY